ncbi:hypothetical protein QQ045_020896 [Rhodiola kirilowii]
MIGVVKYADIAVKANNHGEGMDDDNTVAVEISLARFGYAGYVHDDWRWCSDSGNFSVGQALSAVINYVAMILCAGVILLFGDGKEIGNAYGLVVSIVMLISYHYYLVNIGDDHPLENSNASGCSMLFTS